MKKDGHSHQHTHTRSYASSTCTPSFNFPDFTNKRARIAQSRKLHFRTLKNKTCHAPQTKFGEICSITSKSWSVFLLFCFVPGGTSGSEGPFGPGGPRDRTDFSEKVLWSAQHH